VIERISTKKAAGLVVIVVALSAAIVAPALGVQSPLIFSSPNSYVSEETTSKDVDESQASPAGTVSPSPLDSSLSNDVADPSIAPTARPTAEATPTPIATLSPAPVVVAPAPQNTSAPVSTPTQAPVVQQPPTSAVVGTISVSQVLPGDGIGQAVLQWYLVPGGTEYRIYKTGSIRPAWRLFYVYPPSITSITIFDIPGSIALYKIMAVVNDKEVFLGEVTYIPTS
jgi:hypothetical protein